MKPTRYDEREIEKYLREGHWDTTTLTDYWERNAGISPDKEALVDSEGSRLTWVQSVQKINQIALALIKDAELDPDDRLIIQLPNITTQVLVRLACEKAGILSIPLMPAYRYAELKWVVSQTHAAGIVIPKTYRNFDYFQMAKELQSELPCLRNIIVTGGEVPEGCLSLHELTGYHRASEINPEEMEARKLDPVHDVGFLVTTTGTTGMPKIIEHRIAAREIWTAKIHIRNWQLNTNDVVLAFAPLAGAAGGTPAYVTAPVAGAKIVLEHEFKGEEVLKCIQREKVSVLALVPAQLSRLLQLSVGDYDLSTLRFLKTAGGYLPPALASEAEERFNCPILSSFGSQDTGSISGVPLNATREQRYTTVGRLHPGVEVKVVNEAGEVVKPGEVGTLYFRGPGNSIGYYRDIEKTLTEAYDTDGWATTGDLVTLTNDNWVKIMGRQKDIIIRGGQNIYPVEIEDYLIAHPKIIEAAVVAMPDPIMGEKACAFITVKKGEQITFTEIVDYLESKKIARYKFPERLEIIENMPLANDSKVDKNKLVRLIEEKLRNEGNI